MLLLMKQRDKMESSSAKHLKTHLFFSDFDRHSENNFEASHQRSNSNYRKQNGALGHFNDNYYYQDSDLQSTPISDPNRLLPAAPASGNTTTTVARNRRMGATSPTSQSSLNYSSSSYSSSSGSAAARQSPSDLNRTVADNVQNNNYNRTPFIQISCPRQTDNQVGRSARTTGGTPRSCTPSPKSGAARSLPVPGRHGHAACTTPGSMRKIIGTKIEHLQEDCFIIPAHRMGTFLPIALQFDSEKALGTLSMMHVDDPKLCIILHFAEPSSSLTLQLTALKSSLARVQSAGNASEGMLLMNMERNASYPFIVYLVVNTAQISPCAFLQSYNSIVVDELQPDKLNNSLGTNYISGYEEVATIARPPIDIGPKISSNPKTGYLITIFKVFPGDDREKLERSWLLWTGARMIYKHLPQCLGLRRVTFHKKLWPDGGITYILMCECTNLLDHITIACGFVEQLRARCCGYTALYKSVDKF